MMQMLINGNNLAWLLLFPWIGHLYLLYIQWYYVICEDKFCLHITGIINTLYTPLIMSRVVQELDSSILFDSIQMINFCIIFICSPLKLMFTTIIPGEEIISLTLFNLDISFLDNKNVYPKPRATIIIMKYIALICGTIVNSCWLYFVITSIEKAWVRLLVIMGTSNLNYLIINIDFYIPFFLSLYLDKSGSIFIIGYNTFNLFYNSYNSSNHLL